MIRPSSRRRSVRRNIRYLILLTTALLALDFYSTLTAYKTFSRNLVANTVSRPDDLPSNVRGRKFYIVAQFWTSSALIKDYWADAVFDVINALGADNVYFSIIGSGSLDNTQETLQWFDDEMEQRRIERTIIFDTATHKDAIDAGPTNPDGSEKQGWIFTGESQPPGQKELRRIPYLAALRNRGLEPMLKLQREKGIKFDKILYLNDVIFKLSDVLSLLATNDGVYDAACSLDFHYPPQYYDTFVLRDSNGDLTASRDFPFFYSYESRSTVLNGHSAPVKSCWNGMMVTDAAPYYDQPTLVKTYDADGLSTTTREGLRFRALPDSLASSHVEASECCLIHADLWDRGQVKKGIFMNPAVRVGYTDAKGLVGTSYDYVHIGANGLGYLTLGQYVLGIWKNRWARLTQPVGSSGQIVLARVREWKKVGKSIGQTRQEVGLFCTVDQMQIIIWNGWKHVW